MTEAPTTINLGVDPKYLQKVGITPEVLSRFAFENKTELEKAFKSGHQNGNSAYLAVRDDSIDIPYTQSDLFERKVISIKISDLPKSRFPDYFLAEVQKLKESLQVTGETRQFIVDGVDVFVKDAMKGFAGRASGNNDWETVVNAYDVITEGGFENSTELMLLVNNTHLERENYEQRLKIAQAMEKRAKAKEDATTTSSS